MKENNIYRILNNNTAIRGVFVVALILSLFAPSMFTVIPGFSTVEGINVAEAQEFDFDFDFEPDYNFDFQSVDDYSFDFSNYDFGAVDTGYDSIVFDSYEPYTSLDFVDTWGVNPREDFNAVGGDDDIPFNSVGGDEDSFYPVGGDEDNNFNAVGGDEANNFNPVGGDEQSGFNPVGGDEEESFNPIGGDEETPIIEESGSFPWYLLGLGVIPFLFSDSDSHSSSVVNVVTPAPLAQAGDNPFCPTPVITSSTSANGTVNSAFSYFVSTQSDRAVTITTSGLPSGLSFNGTTISGTPTVSGTFNVILTVSNACGSSTRTLTIVIASIGTACPVPNITSGTSASGTVGNSFAYVVTVDADRAVSITASNLPSGLSLNGNTISGVPTVSGTFTITVTATNNCGTDTQTVTITIAPISSICVPTPTIVSVASASALMGYNFSHTIVALNASSVGVSGLPSGLTFSSGNNVISGVPNTAGTYSVIVTASNNCGTVTQVLTIVVNQPGQPVPPIYQPPTYYPPTYYPQVIYPPTYYPPTYTNPSNIFLSQTPYNVYLNQVPYTGAGDVLLMVLYTIALLMVSAAIAYTSVYGNNYGPLATMLARFKLRYSRFVDSVFGIFSFSQTESDEIESEITEDVEIKDVSVTPVTETPNVNTLIETARAEGALLKANAALFILEVAEQNVIVATSILREVISARANLTKEDEFVLLSERVVREVILETYLSLAPVYGRWLKEGKTEKAQAMLLKLVKLGYDSNVFLQKVDELNAEVVTLTPAYQTA